MDIKQALNVIAQALEAANTGQKFSLKDSATVFSALSVLSEFVKLSTEEVNKKGQDLPKKIEDTEKEEPKTKKTSK